LKKGHDEISKRSTITAALLGVEMEEGENRMRIMRWEGGEKGERGADPLTHNSSTSIGSSCTKREQTEE